MASGTIYTVHEKLEAADPADRVQLVREGFSFFALALNLLWLIGNRLWLAAVGYMLASALMVYASNRLGLAHESAMLLQLLLQLQLGFFAHDLKRANLRRQGYREVGVIVAESPIAAEQRYYQHVG